MKQIFFQKKILFRKIGQEEGWNNESINVGKLWIVVEDPFVVFSNHYSYRDDQKKKKNISFLLDCLTKIFLSTMSTSTKIMKSGTEPPTTFELDVAQVNILLDRSMNE